ncbi:hypothetical protein EUGRSUZ_K02146 [Eucalyptus grandis]|uniref:Uncharacterized protein n=2 Tax=Eucalyptus grandis TaxID=71139 RepID=A0ACC3IVH1_EUCGR|nr:hypothetical protein EUGRSUZ_K02146 [Eucalyptus grandis]
MQAHVFWKCSWHSVTVLMLKGARTLLLSSIGNGGFKAAGVSDGNPSIRLLSNCKATQNKALISGKMYKLIPLMKRQSHKRSRSSLDQFHTHRATNKGSD